MGSLFQRVQTRGEEAPLQTSAVHVPLRGGKGAHPCTRTMPTLHPPSLVQGHVTAWKWEGLSIKQSREFVVKGVQGSA